MFLHRAVITKRRINVLHDGKSLFKAYTTYPTKKMIAILDAWQSRRGTHDRILV